MTAVPDQQTAAERAIAGQRAEDDLRALFGQSTALFAVLTGPEHVVATANPAFLAVVGDDRARIGVALVDLMPELAGQGFIELLDEVYRTGEHFVGRDVRMVLGDGPDA